MGNGWSAGDQSNHIWQDKAFEGWGLSRNDGPATWLHGQAAVAGTEHNLFHAQTEALFARHQRAGTTPTVREYMNAAVRGLKSAGISEEEAGELIQNSIPVVLNSYRRFKNQPNATLIDVLSAEIPHLPRPVGGFPRH